MRARRGSFARIAQTFRAKKFDQQHETCTEISLDDHGEKRVDEIISEAINQTGFLSRSRLLKILTEKSIETELRKNESFFERHPKLTKPLNYFLPELNSSQRNDFHSDILTILGKQPGMEQAAGIKSYTIILAILILIERPTKIQRFIEVEVCDSDLPLLKSRSHGKLRLFSQSTPDRPLTCFDGWSNTDMDKFERRQWTFLAPFFAAAENMLVPHLDVCSRQILPFKDCDVIRKGGFGVVQKMAIHRDHRAFGNKDKVRHCSAHAGSDPSPPSANPSFFSFLIVRILKHASPYEGDSDKPIKIIGMGRFRRKMECSI